ncbi:ABC transporter permease [Luteolibacter yonseiensis]|uniref:ABC transporter permease n=1 Tax=Luteolibacter yonseiensis TaxID=1144680 RepID=A0A934VDA3_9BACT|nr:FtsX-like permease family protein [Luteolibacter yonseiensis]MBK1817940.1 ABC transporter permease [Luteolibacter yonseiensis]
MNPRRSVLSSFSLISLVGVMLGVLALVVVMSVFAGLERNVKQRYLEALPHVLLMRDHRMVREEADEAISMVKKLPNVESATAYVADNVVIDAPIDQRPVDFRAVDTSDPVQVAGLEKLLDKKAYPGSSADLGIDDRVVISSLVAENLHISVGDKIRLISTRNVREVMRIFKSTERPPVREAFPEVWKKISPVLGSGWKVDGDKTTLTLAEYRETYAALQAIYEDDIRQAERDKIESILFAMDESAINETDGVFIFPAESRQRIETSLAELGVTDTEKMDAEVLKSLKSLVLPKEVEVMGIYPASMMAATPALFVPLPLAQDLAGLGDSVQGIRITLTDPYEAENFKAAAGRSFDPDWTWHTWGEAYEPFFRLIGQQRVMMYFVLIFIMLVSAFSIMAVMFTITIQKRREIGVMKSLGASSGQIIRVFLYQGMILGSLGGLLGVGLGRIVIAFRGELQGVLRIFGFDPFSAALIGSDILPAYNDAWEQAAFATIAFLLCSLAAFVPAYFAARSDAAKSLRNL